MFLACAFLVLHSLKIQFSVGLGLVLMACSILMPLRRQEEKWDLFWDVAGWLAAVVFAFTTTQLFTQPLNQWLRGLAWVQEYHRWLQGLPAWLAVLLILLLVDFFYYWGHRLVHHPRLWNHHAWHHSPTYLTWLTGSRTTLVNHLVIIGMPVVAALLLCPMPRAGPWAVFVMAFLRLVDHVHHTNLYVPWARQLEWVFITPRLHYVHHSNDPRFSHSNFGLTFTFCDRLFGTYRDPDSMQADFPLGLAYANENWRLLLGLPPKA